MVLIVTTKLHFDFDFDVELVFIIPNWFLESILGVLKTHIKVSTVFNFELHFLQHATVMQQVLKVEVVLIMENAHVMLVIKDRAAVNVPKDFTRYGLIPNIYVQVHISYLI